MRTHIVFLAIAFVACNAPTQKVEVVADTTSEANGQPRTTKEEVAAYYEIFGDTIAPEGATLSTDKAVDSVLAATASGPVAAKLRGVATSVCQRKGCWMKVALPGGKLLHVTFKDYTFFVPPQLTGEEAIFEGVATRDTVSVDDLREYALDEGKTADEIAAITKPEVGYLFDARGVLVEKGKLKER